MSQNERKVGRSWTCACGRVVIGNGGRASHQRACREYKESNLAHLEDTVEKIDQGEWGRSFRPEIRRQFRRQFSREIKEARKELAS